VSLCAIDVTKSTIVTYFIAVCFEEILVHLPEDGEIITPKHVGAV